MNIEFTDRDKIVINKAKRIADALDESIDIINGLSMHIDELEEQKKEGLEKAIILDGDYKLKIFDKKGHLVSQINDRKSYINIIEIAINDAENRINDALHYIYSELREEHISEYDEDYIT